MPHRNTVGILRLLPVFAVLAGTGVSSQAPGAERAAIENPDVAGPIVEAQKLAAKRQWAAALVALQKAQAVPEKSPYAEYKIDEFLAYVLTQQRKYDEAARITERMVRSGQAPKEKRDDHIRTAAQLYFNAKNYAKANEYAERGLELRPGDAGLLEIAGQAQYLVEDYKEAARTMQQLVAVAERAGNVPHESWLQIILNSHHQLGNAAAIPDVLQQLLRYHPKRDYWDRLFARKDVGDYSPGVKLGYYRLMFEVGALRSPDDIEEMALTAIDVGAAGEAVRVLDWALSKNLLTANKSRYERMLRFAREKAAEQAASQADLERAALGASTGEADAALGASYLAARRYDQAVDALERAIRKGGLSDPNEVRTHLTVAYLNSNRPKRAESTAAAIDPKSDWYDLAAFWILSGRGKEA